MKIIITGSSLSGNKGAMAMTLVAVDELRRIAPMCEIKLISKYPNLDRPLAEKINVGIVPALPAKFVTSTLLRACCIKLFNFLPRQLFLDDILKSYCEADVMVDLGGVTFSDDRDWRGLMLSIAFLMPAVAVDLPAAKLSQALGPFNKLAVRLSAKYLLPKCALLIGRGQYTSANIMGLLGEGFCHEASDVAFLLRASSDDQVAAYLKESGLPQEGFVGVSPSAVVDRKARAKRIDYRETMVRLIDHTISYTGLPVVLIPHAWPSGGKGMEDLELSEEIQKHLSRKENAYVVRDDLDARMLKGIIAKSEIYIACRFHAMIASISTNVPTFVIGWGHKYREIMKIIDCENYVCDFSKADFKIASEYFIRLYEKREEIKKKIVSALPALKASAQENFNLIEQLLESKKLI